MYKVRITLPAAITNLGPGLHSLGLAAGLYTTVEIVQRHDESLVVEADGEGAGRYPVGLRHPVALAMIRLFQMQERAPLGLTVRISNHIPLDSGLGAEAAFWVAGVIAANNLLGNVYSRQQVLEFAARFSQQPDSTTATILGGLTAALLDADTLVHRPLPTSALHVAVVVPELNTYSDETTRARPERLPLTDALYNLSRIPLLIDAFRDGDLHLLERVMADRIQLPFLKRFIPGCDHVIEMARRAGAVAITLTGTGPALVAFAESDHRKVALAMEVAFENVGVRARSWVLPIDTQGVVVSVSG